MRVAGEKSALVGNAHGEGLSTPFPPDVDVS